MKQLLQLITVCFHQCHSPSASSPAMFPSTGGVCGFFVLLGCLLTHCAAVPGKERTYKFIKPPGTCSSYSLGVLFSIRGKL